MKEGRVRGEECEEMWKCYRGRWSLEGNRWFSSKGLPHGALHCHMVKLVLTVSHSQISVVMVTKPLNVYW